jgi:hypothetical protein
MLLIKQIQMKLITGRQGFIFPDAFGLPVNHSGCHTGYRLKKPQEFSGFFGDLVNKRGV